MSKAWLDAARQIDGLADCRPRRSRRRPGEGAGARIRARRRRHRHRPRRDARPDQAGRRVRRRGSRRAPRRRALGLRPRLPSADRKADGRQSGECARDRRGGAPRPGASTPSCRTAATSPMSAASGASSTAARSASRPASMPTSSSRRISAASARRWHHVLLLDMAIHTFDAARFMVERRAGRRLLPRMGAGGSWYRHGSSANAIFDLGDGIGLHLSRLLVRRRRPHQLGERMAHRRRARHAHLGRR